MININYSKVDRFEYETDINSSVTYMNINNDEYFITPDSNYIISVDIRVEGDGTVHRINDNQNFEIKYYGKDPKYNPITTITVVLRNRLALNKEKGFYNG